MRVDDNSVYFIKHFDHRQVSVRLHDELEAVEEKRMKAEDEANRVKDYLKEVENSRAALQTELQNLHNEVNKPLFHRRTMWSTKMSYETCIMR